MLLCNEYESDELIIIDFLLKANLNDTIEERFLNGKITGSDDPFFHALEISQDFFDIPLYISKKKKNRNFCKNSTPKLIRYNKKQRNPEYLYNRRVSEMY